jgi:hypothetical protein
LEKSERLFWSSGILRCHFFDRKQNERSVNYDEEKTMLNRKTIISLSLAGLLAANAAFALPGFADIAPQSSIDACVAEVDANANFAEAHTVTHNVVTEERRVSGFKMNIRTIVYGEGETVIREYASHCAIDGEEEIRRFRIRQTGA